ncbi:RNA-binding cell elongation regulator Jag/EloR [Caldibacillus thermoamylovorans]|uniref:RNA-binding cell elongation regulator Jag/EloR n=1 Tax=Caldibacillus thermoamylovorans TaxID=35841 RepID=UPI00203CE2F8|nr:RNA-binding cell elongation regulator Jag/EloR [Caldibacillus thermoamylovorans]MCM3055170.1 protein jag [Caldibacillus thermoamylovorans]
MKELTATGQTVEEAIEKGISQLKVSREKVDIKVINEGKKGIFGIFGSRLAIVKLTVNVDPVMEAKQFLSDVCKQMDVEVNIESTIDGKYVYFQLNSDKTGLLIGKRGQTLNALQILTQVVLNRFSEEFMNVILNAENYREKREETLVLLANRLANKVIKEKKEISLEPMPSFERKIIHAALADNEKIKTYSVGTDPHRHLVISPK